MSNLCFQPDTAVTALQRLLSDPEWHVQMMAIYALSSYKEEATPVLDDITAFLNNPEWQLQEVAAFCLGEMGRPALRSLPSLQQLLRNDKNEIALQVTVKRAIEKIRL